MATHWPWVPIEIYTHILSFLAPTPADEACAVRTLVACLSANSRLRGAALAPAVWEQPYRMRYTESVAAHERARRAASDGDWRRMYLARRALDARALVLVDAIRARAGDRHAAARELAQELSFDVWDVLARETRLPLPRYLRTDEDAAAAPPPHALTRRYWARAAMGVIARYHTMEVWGAAGNGSIGFEEALAGLAAFFDENPRQIYARLDQLADNCRHVLIENHVELDTLKPGYDLSELCIGIRSFLRSVGFDSASGTGWYNVLIQFPHTFLDEGPLRKTIPMSLVYLFVAVARRLGVRAAPTNFPGKILCHIAPVNPNAMDMLFDMCSDSRPHVFTSKTPARMLADVGLPTDAPVDYVRPCTVATLMHRVGANIVMSVRWHHRSPTRVPPEIPQWAHYAAACIFMFHAPDHRLFANVLDCKPLDVVAVLQDAVCPALTPVMRDGLSALCNEHIKRERDFAASVWDRPEDGSIKFFAGLVVEHVDFGFVGCIRGWHPQCLSISDLSALLERAQSVRGWDQPFYWVITTTGHQKYVAEEKLRPVPVTKDRMRDMFANVSVFGRYFDDVEICGERGRVLLSDEVKQMYPHDDAAGARWTAFAALDQ